MLSTKSGTSAYAESGPIAAPVDAPRSRHPSYHQMSPKHLDRYVTEFSGRHNAREADTIDQMQSLARAMVGKRLRYDDLAA